MHLLSNIRQKQFKAKKQQIIYHFKCYTEPETLTDYGFLKYYLTV